MIRSAILATIIYYDIFDYPLTLLEVHKFLVNPGRLSHIEGRLGEINLGDISKELDRLASSKILGETNGFYFLDGRGGLYDLRMARHKIADQKWKKFLRAVKFLALTPYLRGIFASGSMAIYNTDEKSDFDVLVIAKSGRLYTCRFFLWLISSVLGSRRKRHERVAPDKLCFNHYLTDGDMKLVHQSIFNAQTYVNLKPVMIKPVMIDKFYASNLWLNDYVCNFRTQKDFVRRSVSPPAIFRFFARMAELFLDSLLGNALENVLKNFQQKKIRENQVTYEPGGRVVFTERELEFHPRSFEAEVIRTYNKNLKKFGIVSHVIEADSGLNQL